jgi:hypothetical protein
LATSPREEKNDTVAGECLLAALGILRHYGSASDGSKKKIRIFTKDWRLRFVIYDFRRNSIG